ncbi:folylpolyglutamate synthase/dihydrofolate synthase family protein [Paucisalibacillus sp. EB02]|uniref:bifunctional folylpolyglutamate synthase/dihydrofolate synthase n=1 Tax=Paucisalibacillus sp. EB02 TaxID=1347087 RepID=UPI0004B94DBC|nr:folylpolyglutamate synthase/dihydrofolate synthase family protein [Paucisalibacillus sp. EB02]
MLQSLEQVESFFDGRKAFGIKPGLTRMYRLLKSQSNPQLTFQAIHIAGTNGKGSTLTFIKDALQENNYKVGVFTSPSLTGYTGHMLINEQPIGKEHFLRLLNQLLPVIHTLDLEEMYPTEFEIITTIAFMYFAGNVDIAIIETGMGGRKDATNCIQPILSIITNIAMDHAKFLGNTLEKIAYHKAGIIKQNVPTVIGDVHPTCLPVIYKEVTNKNSPIYQLNNDFTYEETLRTRNSHLFKWRYKEWTYPIEIQMKGQHQVENASIAMMALKIINEQGLPLDWDNVYRALSSAQLTGRFERVHEKPVIILDGAHNPNGMEAFLHTVRHLYGNNKKHLIFAGFHDKELIKMIKMALPVFDTVSVTSFDHPRAEKAENLMESLPTGMVKHVNWSEKITEIQSQHDIYFFVGSLAFIGIVRDYITKKMM